MLLISRVSTAETATISRVEQSAKLSALAIQDEVLESSVGSPGWSLADGESADTLTFSRCTGSADGKRLWSGPITYRQEGDRLLRLGPEGQREVSGDLRSLSFSLSGGVLRVTVTAQGSHGDRYYYNATCSLDVAPRN
jgi:hypothetical protein